MKRVHARGARFGGDLRAQAQSRLTAADARLIVGNSRVERAEKLIQSAVK